MRKLRTLLSSLQPQQTIWNFGKKNFNQSLVPYVAKYGKDMVRAFYDYWTEKTYGGRKMRFEKQQAFEISKRLATWQKHDFELCKQR